MKLASFKAVSSVSNTVIWVPSLREGHCVAWVRGLATDPHGPVIVVGKLCCREERHFRKGRERLEERGSSSPFTMAPNKRRFDDAFYAPPRTTVLHLPPLRDVDQK
jgi:hypothetical protein